MISKVVGFAFVAGAQASSDPILSYTPGSNVMDHARIDLDQYALESVLSTSYAAAKNVIDNGGHSKSYADCTLDTTNYQALKSAVGSATIAKGTKVFFQAVGSAAQQSAGVSSYLEGKLYASYDTSGATAPGTFRIQYNVPGEPGDATTFVNGKPENTNHAQCWNNPNGLTTAWRSADGCISGTDDTTSVFVVGTGASGVTGCATGEVASGATGGFSTCATATPQITATCTTKNGRKLAGFSTAAKSKMYDPSLSTKDCPDSMSAPQNTKGYPNGCPYTSFIPYFNYYCSGGSSPCNTDGGYADRIVDAALDGDNSAQGLTNGGMDFTGVGDAARQQFVKKGTAYMHAWMYAVREFEDAIDDCVVGIAANNDDPVHAWDEGVAFYVGTMTDAELAATEAGTSTPGKLAYTLANKRCKNFKTCGADGTAPSGEAKVNKDLWTLFTAGKNALEAGDCGGVVPIKDNIVKKMTVPLVQGTLRYAYKLATAATAGLKEHGEGAVFAAAVLPQVHACNPFAASTIFNNLNINNNANPIDFNAVKSAFEGCYSHMGITCDEVGGLWENGAYMSATGSAAAYNGGSSDATHAAKTFDASPCVDATSRRPPPPPAPPSPPPAPAPPQVEVMPSWAIIIIIVVAILAVAFVFACCYLVKAEKAGKPIFHPLNLNGGSKGGASPSQGSNAA